jgi:hypothetical protein
MCSLSVTYIKADQGFSLVFAVQRRSMHLVKGYDEHDDGGHSVLAKWVAKAS